VYPHTNEKIVLLNLTTCGETWVIKKKIVTVIEDVTVLDNNNVRLVATVYGRQFYCERPFYPTTLDELRVSGWKPVVSSRSTTSPHHHFVEAVIAFNVHRELGKSSSELVCDQTRTAVVPHEYNAYCATHDRVHYWGEPCQKCREVLASAKRAMLAA
jgi:hypothetical protein